MARPCKQNGRSQRTKENATGYSWGRKKEEKKTRKMWLDEVEDDLRKTGVKRWRIRQWIGQCGEKYMRRPRFFKSCSAVE
jgi:hypothetical protein